MTNKITFVNAIDEAVEVLSTVEGFNPEVVSRLCDLKASIQKRQASRSTKKNDSNEAFKAVVRKALANVGKPATVTELLATNLFEAGTSNQKLSAILKQMVETDKTVVKTVDKKKSFFSLAESAEEVEEE